MSASVAGWHSFWDEASVSECFEIATHRTTWVSRCR